MGELIACMSRGDFILIMEYMGLKKENCVMQSLLTTYKIMTLSYWVRHG